MNTKVIVKSNNKIKLNKIDTLSKRNAIHNTIGYNIDKVSENIPAYGLTYFF